MKLATFVAPDDTIRVGALIEGETAVAALQTGVEAMEGAPLPYFEDMLAFLAAGPAARYKAHVVMDFVGRQKPPGAVFPLGVVRLLAPLPRPRSIRVGLAFEGHAIALTRHMTLGRLAGADLAVERRFGRRASLAVRLNRRWPRQPVCHRANRFSVVGHEAVVRAPPYARQLDYELSWAVCIGKEGRDIAVKDARSHIAGYLVFNDFTARDAQAHEWAMRHGPSKSKDFDTGNAMGPWLATPDEIANPYALAMRARVNGEERARGSTADMYWTFEQIVAHASRAETLHPGEILASGAWAGPAGHGSGFPAGRYLEPGDVVELEVERIGVLRNRVAARDTGGVKVATKRGGSA